MSTTERMNVLLGQLTTKAVKEAKCEEPKWSRESAPLLEIGGKAVTKKEGVMLSIAAEREKFEEWQRQKLGKSGNEY